MFLVTPSVLHVMLGFVFFRVFDIVKPFPARLFQNRLPGGYGIVLDDVVAGIYANLLLLILVKFWGI
jgi:phosphatidylglycerophosphatase A